MTDTFRVRFRFRLQHFLNIPATEHLFEVDGRDVVLSSMADTNISDSSWLVMNVRGFENEQEATSFAAKLKAACEFSSVAARLGVDAGVDLPTSAFSSMVKDIIREQSGMLLRNNVHGLDVFRDHPSVRIGIIHASGKLLVAPDPFLSDLTRFYEQVDGASQTTRDMVLLLNYALMRPDPVAKIVFAVESERISRDFPQLVAKGSEIWMAWDQRHVFGKRPLGQLPSRRRPANDDMYQATHSISQPSPMRSRLSLSIRQ